MSQPTDVETEAERLDENDVTDVPDEISDEGAPSYDEEKLADLQYVLQPTRLRLLQQILATDWGSLSPAELSFRNPDVSESTIRDHLREMTGRDRPLTAKLTVPEGKGERAIPRTFYAVTEYGIQLLKRVDMYDGISLLYQAYESAERPDEIGETERFEHRPEPDWL
jgi:hypothetical protein